MSTSQYTNEDHTPNHTPDRLNHIGIIMDGNGRWATQHFKDRSYGHINGIDPIKNSVLVAIKYDVKYITLYVFSTENWKRPKREVKFILDTVSGKLREHYPFYREHNIKVLHSGDRSQLSKKTLSELDSVINETKENTGIVLNLAFNYGGRNEIIRAFNKFQRTNEANASITEDMLSQYLDNPEIPDVDLMIRTGAETRISNFLLWQIAYAELYFSDVLWPNWSKEDMTQAINYYNTKQRRYGGL